MTKTRLEELRQLAGAVDGQKSAWMDELIEEVDKLRDALERLCETVNPDNGPTVEVPRMSDVTMARAALHASSETKR